MTYLQNSAHVLLSVTRYWLIISSLQWRASLGITHLFDVINGGNNSSSWVKIVGVVNFCILGHQHLSPHYSHCACHQPHFHSQKSTPTLSNCFCFLWFSGGGKRKKERKLWTISNFPTFRLPKKTEIKRCILCPSSLTKICTIPLVTRSCTIPSTTKNFAQFLQQQKIYVEFPLTTIILHNSIIFIRHGNLGH